MSGFFLVRRESVDLDRLRPRGFKILLEILVRTPNLARAEIPFRFGERFAGDSKASLREGLVYIGQLVRLRFGATAHDFTRFGLVGAIGLGVNMVLFAFFLRVVGLNYLAAAVVATQGSTLSNFILTERWVFARRDHRLGDRSRLALFFLMNNLTLLLRGPLLVLLVSGAGLNELLANFLSLVALTVVRYAVADTVIWSPASKGAAEKRRPVGYDIHGIVTVMSDVPLPELEAFRTDERLDRPTIRVRIGKLSAKQSELVAALAFFARHIRYDERLGRFGFGIEIGVGRSIEILASPLLKWSPHVLYTNVVEPVLRWTVVKKGYALVHGACVAADGTAHLITARTDTGKTTTILRALDRYPGLAFVSDDLTLVRADGTVLTYPKPLTVSQHTVRAVRTPLLSPRERLMLVYQSRIHSRSGRRFAFLLAGARLPTATINAIVQLLVPPPKYRIERLVPGVEVATESKLGGIVVIERGPDADVRLDGDEALEILMANCDDAYGFPPYSTIAPFLHGSNGRDLRREERAIVAQALIDLPAVLLRSDRMAWAERLPAVVGHPAVEGDADDALPILSPA